MSSSYWIRAQGCWRLSYWQLQILPVVITQLHRWPSCFIVPNTVSCQGRQWAPPPSTDNIMRQGWNYSINRSKVNATPGLALTFHGCHRKLSYSPQLVQDQVQSQADCYHGNQKHDYCGFLHVSRHCNLLGHTIKAGHHCNLLGHTIKAGHHWTARKSSFYDLAQIMQGC